MIYCSSKGRPAAKRVVERTAVACNFNNVVERVFADNLESNESLLQVVSIFVGDELIHMNKASNNEEKQQKKAGCSPAYWLSCLLTQSQPTTLLRSHTLRAVKQ